MPKKPGFLGNLAFFGPPGNSKNDKKVKNPFFWVFEGHSFVHCAAKFQKAFEGENCEKSDIYFVDSWVFVDVVVRFSCRAGETRSKAESERS